VPTISAHSHLLYEGVGKSVLQLKKKLEDFCKEEIKKTSDKGTIMKIFKIRDASCNKQLKLLLQHINKYFVKHRMMNPRLLNITSFVSFISFLLL